MRDIAGSPLGIAVVGAGGVARTQHLPAWSARTDARVLWVMDVNESSAASAAEVWRVPACTEDLANVLADPAVDVVDLCTPPEVHAEQARAVLAAGKHLLVEKPATCTLAEMRAVADAADVAQTVAMVAENWLFCPGIVRVQELIEHGELGELLSIVVTLETGQAIARALDEQRSLLLNAGVHVVNTVRALFGDPTHVAAFSLGNRTGSPSGADADTALAVSLRFTGGRVGSLALSALAQRHRPGVREVRIHGTRGMAEFDVLGGWIEWSTGAWHGDARHRWQAQVGSWGSAEEVERFVVAVRGRTTDYPSLRDQVRTHQVLEAIRDSARKLVTVEVPPAS